MATILSQLADPLCPIETKIGYLQMLVIDQKPASKKLLAQILESIGKPNAEADVLAKQKQITELLEILMAGPIKSVVFAGLLPDTDPPRGEILFEDGSVGFCVITDSDLASNLKAGDQVLCDKGGVVLLRLAAPRIVGEEAELTRKIDSRHIEITDHAQRKSVVLASQTLLDKLAAEQVKIGDVLIVNERQKIAFDALPTQDGHAHYRFLSRESVPDVLVDRDIGSPPACINRITELVRLEMTKPELRRRYGLRRTSMTLLAGVSGSGKTLAIQAIHRNLYGIMADMTGVPVDVLPPRVFRLKLSTVLSMWLGESDKNLDRFFSEVEQLADEPFICPKGKSWQLPVLAIMEEVDGIARQRGGHDGQHHDRILTTMLQRLDSSRPEMKSKLIVFIGTTNDAHHLDRAFLRRIGGTIEKFGRLDRDGFLTVLHKHLKRTVTANPGISAAKLATWLFDQNGDEQPLLYVTYAGKSAPESFYRRDWLTGAVVDASVQEASQMALQAEIEGIKEGITTRQLQAAFTQQIEAIADQLTEFNAGHYLDLPSGAQISNLRRIK